MRKPLPMVVEPDEPQPLKDHAAVVPDGSIVSIEPCARLIEAMIKDEYPRLRPGARLTLLAQRIAKAAYSDTHELNKLFWNPTQGSA